MSMKSEVLHSLTSSTLAELLASFLTKKTCSILIECSSLCLLHVASTYSQQCGYSHVVCVQTIGWKCQQVHHRGPQLHSLGPTEQGQSCRVSTGLCQQCEARKRGVAVTREGGAPELAATVGTMRRCNNVQITQTVFKCCPFLFLEMLYSDPNANV